jgi:hypothetical protein
MTFVASHNHIHCPPSNVDACEGGFEANRLHEIPREVHSLPNTRRGESPTPNLPNLQQARVATVHPGVLLSLRQ